MSGYRNKTFFATVALAVVVVAPACSNASSSAHDRSSPYDSASVQTSGPPSVLECGDSFAEPTGSASDSAGDALPARKFRANGLYSAAWKGSGWYRFPIKDATDGIAYTSTDGKTYGASKTPVGIKRNIGTRRIKLISPDDAVLIVAGAKPWASGDPLKSFTSKTRGPYTLKSCQKRNATFPGAILVREPSCVVLKVTDPARKDAETVKVPMYGGSCQS